MTQMVDKGLVKEALRELIQEEPELFRNMLKEILSETTISADNDAEFDQLVQQNFQRFDATFKALA
ncbi:hypothetical protein [Fibrella forsythiae]|uniref:Uncharacterized protein n=1 Tax=Fibrella forsythiae TaxID=2817061 RepID=A0ABS3JIR6_9BACT|nr:hypothetical protein [Fibrella forsythiae]MBO0949303.1 hypothetical protein [Fibrella forsythiae]